MSEVMLIYNGLVENSWQLRCNTIAKTRATVCDSVIGPEQDLQRQNKTDAV